MSSSKIFLIACVFLFYAKLVDSYAVNKENFTEELHVPFDSPFNIVESEGLLVFVSYPSSATFTIKIDDGFCELSVPSITEKHLIIEKDSRSLGNGKILVTLDVRSEDRENRDRIFILIDPQECDYSSAKLSVNEDIDVHWRVWSIVPYEDTFDVFYTAGGKCPANRICRNTYNDQGELVNTMVTNLPAALEAFWTISSINGKNSDDGFFFVTIYYDFKPFIVRKLNSELDIVKEENLHTKSKIYFQDYHGRIILRSTIENNEYGYELLDSNLNTILKLITKHQSNVEVDDFGYFADDIVFEVLTHKDADEGDIPKPYIRFIDAEGHSSNLLKFHDDGCRMMFRTYHLKDNLRCIAAMCRYVKGRYDRAAIVKCITPSSVRSQFLNAV